MNYKKIGRISLKQGVFFFCVKKYLIAIKNLRIDRKILTRYNIHVSISKKEGC